MSETNAVFCHYSIQKMSFGKYFFFSDFCVFHTFFLKTEVTTNEGELFSFSKIQLFGELGKES